MTIENYIDNINQRYKLGNATEHTFRGDLQQLIESLVPEVRATNEPKRQSCGAPDYILTKKDIPVGFIEAKDLGDKDLEGKKKSVNKEQFDRYKASLDNLIFTDYIDFHLYNDGEFVTKIAIAEITEKGIVALPQNFARFENLIKDFCTHIGQNIKSSKKLAEMMAGKARLLSDVIEKALTSDEDNQEDSTLKEQMTAFKSILIHDITPKGFADVYAQTIAYGMFAARLHDPTLDTFSRQEAAELIPKSNPFLRKLFGYIAGPDIDDRIKWIVDNLTEIFLACNVEEILKNYGKTTKMEDPIIHFYETFLAEYDPKLRKARGVWYTPAPVVNFIVRAVDDILKTEFDLSQGLADTSKTKITVNTQTPDKRSATGYKQMEQEVHKVQILDPATGTGTFLAEVIKHVNKKFKGQEGIWSGYVENHLLPRLNGFELLMASYAMAHLQLDLLLKETGFKATSNQRTRVYLTNSLEEYHPDTGTLFANWLSSEANEANHIKRDSPVMCIIGNPPYSGESANKGDWIMDLMQDYKKEPGGKEKLKEQNSKFINDDYVKFLRYGQHFIEKNGSGVLAFINPHGFLDNPTFRGMRWHLLKTYDKIYTIDLHGNNKKKETAPDGSADVNVFDIEQGVSINFFIKTGKKKANELGKVYHHDLFGKREDKYDFLIKNNLKSTPYKELKIAKPNYFFKFIDFEQEKQYNEGFSIPKLFPLNSLGLLTKRDNLSVGFNSQELTTKIKFFLDDNKSAEEVCNHFNLVIKDKDKWDAQQTKSNVSQSDVSSQIRDIQYRPFDNRKVFYNPYFVARPNPKVLSHFINDNAGLIICRQGQAVGGGEWNVVFTCKYLTDQNIYRRGGGTIFPLYIYPENSEQQTIEESAERKPNLNQEIVNEIAKKLDLTFTNEKEITENTFAPIDILNFIYAILHSRKYREKYKEFLKTDYPKIPYPKDKNKFWELVKLGGEIRQIHLLESPKVEDYITTYPKGGDNTVTTKIGKKDWELFDEEKQLGRIWINEEQYFDSIPLTAWEFYIGGYQPAQKWLKDRKERTLEFDDILHYQKIIVALSETERLMKEIDKIEIQ
ncbi:type ISP restriction/modification enzyme [Aquimarina macrocephali]|uniref:type ISP restriction/modification enzyme n=1 Tax=Aquimarina macrocephali TaxID=666563 RepID=UPI000466CE2B|nr:type ISP restriction/modification enzyme [Aquimarina macrocephali]